MDRADVIVIGAGAASLMCGITYREKMLGQLFCDNSSKDIIAMLVNECDDADVRVLKHCADTTISQDGAYAVKCIAANFPVSLLCTSVTGFRDTYLRSASTCRISSALICPLSAVLGTRYFPI